MPRVWGSHNVSDCTVKERHRQMHRNKSATGVCVYSGNIWKTLRVFACLCPTSDGSPAALKAVGQGVRGRVEQSVSICLNCSFLLIVGKVAVSAELEFEPSTYPSRWRKFRGNRADS